MSTSSPFGKWIVGPRCDTNTLVGPFWPVVWKPNASHLPERRRVAQLFFESKGPNQKDEAKSLARQLNNCYTTPQDLDRVQHVTLRTPAPRTDSDATIALSCLAYLMELIEYVPNCKNTVQAWDTVRILGTITDSSRNFINLQDWHALCCGIPKLSQHLQNSLGYDSYTTFRADLTKGLITVTDLLKALAIQTRRGLL